MVPYTLERKATQLKQGKVNYSLKLVISVDLKTQTILKQKKLSTRKTFVLHKLFSFR